MPSFLSKVFGRKKSDDKRASNGSLLEGKFEAVSPNVSPTADNFTGTPHGNGHAKDSFTLFKTKSRTILTPEQPHEPRIDLPQLSLHLPGPKDDSNSRALGVVFEADPDAQILLPESVIAKRRLTPLEALILIRACSQAITERGLETLGIMHPHWYSASPEAQRKLISLFIQSLAPNSPITTLSPTLTAPTSAFESEIQFTRSPHDVAAVLRWGLRHQKLDGAHFGKDEQWYQKFAETERSSGYPPTAYSDTLVPLLPPAHLELLSATLEIISSLAAHAEANSISGSKLSKFLGLWLLTSQRALDTDDWSTFYARWERAGRMLEHLFLARVRQEALAHRMPLRLSELVKHYPYAKVGTPSSEADLLPRPRFSTRRNDALFVHIDTQLPLDGPTSNPKHHPLKLISEAFTSEPSSTHNDLTALWAKIQKIGTEGDESSPGGYPGLSRILADETIRFLSLLPADNSGEDPTSPTFTLFLSDKSSGVTRRRSLSMSDGEKALSAAPPSASPSGHSKTATTPSSSTPSPLAPLSKDWAEFSTSGFLETIPMGAPLAATLLDSDVEVTAPRAPSKRAKPAPRVSSPVRGRLSLEKALPRISTDTSTSVSTSRPKPTSKSNQISLILLDEAFIDFWSDALLDPISYTWPRFVICKLKQSVPGLEVVIGDETKRIDWLVVEQSFSRPAPPAPPPTSSPSTTTAEPIRRVRPSSPKPSLKSELSSTFSATKRKRFSFFSRTHSGLSSDNVVATATGRKKATRIGEMGEILTEADEKVEKKVEVQASDADALGLAEQKVEKTSDGHGLEVSGLAVGAIGVAAGAAVLESDNLGLLNEAASSPLGNSSTDAPVSDISSPIPDPPTSDTEQSHVASDVILPTDMAAPVEPSVSSEEGHPGTEPEHVSEPVIVAKEDEAEVLSTTQETITEPSTIIYEPPAVSSSDIVSEPQEIPARVSEEAVLEPIHVSAPESHVSSDTTVVPPIDAAVGDEDVVPAAIEEELGTKPEPVTDSRPEITTTVAPHDNSSIPSSPITDDAVPQPPLEVSAITEADSLVVETDAHVQDTVSRFPSLPAVPVVESDSIPASHITVEPVNFEEPPALSLSDPETESSIADTRAAEHETSFAPESVILSGGTPGPDVALSTSEPVAIAQAATNSPDDIIATTTEVEQEKGSEIATESPAYNQEVQVIKSELEVQSEDTPEVGVADIDPVENSAPISDTTSVQLLNGSVPKLVVAEAASVHQGGTDLTPLIPTPDSNHPVKSEPTSSSEPITNGSITHPAEEEGKPLTPVGSEV